MKKRIILIGTIIVLSIAIAVGIWLLTSPKPIGNISHSYTEQTTTTSNISFTAESGERIKFSFRSNVEIGDLDIFLYDSAGIEVYKLDRAKELETFFNLPASGEYMLAAECGNFIGSFDIKVFEAD